MAKQYFVYDMLNVSVRKGNHQAVCINKKIYKKTRQVSFIKNLVISI